MKSARLYLVLLCVAVLVFGGALIGWNLYQNHLQTQSTPLLGSVLDEFDQNIGESHHVSSQGDSRYTTYVYDDTGQSAGMTQYQVKIRENLIAEVDVIQTYVTDSAQTNSLCQHFLPQDANQFTTYNRSPLSHHGDVYKSNMLAQAFSHQAFSDNWQGAPMPIQWGVFVMVSSSNTTINQEFCSLRLGYPSVNWPALIQA